MNSSARISLQKRKRALQESRQTPISIDQSEIREAARKKLAQVLEDAAEEGGDLKPADVARQMEDSLNKKYKAHTAEYKSSYRRLYVSLKNNKLEFSANLLKGTIDPREFATRSADQLKSSKQQDADSNIREKNIQQSVAQQLLPETVNQIKDGRDREKWGVSRSAAAVDD